MNTEILLKAMSMIGEATPLKTDCGQLCGCACCSAGTENAGVWLLPGEEAVPHEWAETNDTVLPVTKMTLKMIMCRELCKREARPFMCRIFPLTPFYSKKREVWDVRMDRRAAPLCPLFGYGIKSLDPAFVEGVRAAVRILSQDPGWVSVLEKLAAEEQVYRMGFDA